MDDRRRREKKLRIELDNRRPLDWFLFAHSRRSSSSWVTLRRSSSLASCHSLTALSATLTANRAASSTFSHDSPVIKRWSGGPISGEGAIPSMTKHPAGTILVLVHRWIALTSGEVPSLVEMASRKERRIEVSDETYIDGRWYDK